MGFPNLKYFKLEEFDSSDHKGSGINMDTNFLLLLDKARDIAQVPFQISSGYRTNEHNKRVGGVQGSSHTKGYAADIVTTSSTHSWVIMQSLLKVGFNRIGIKNSFIHVDNDPDKPHSCLWTYN